MKKDEDIIKYLIVRDNREKVGTWNFIKSKYCEGTIDGTLSTGDYTIDKMQDIFSIERKATTGEIAGNVYTKQFLNEMKRGDKLRHFWVLCEFSLKDVLNYPYGSGVPKRVWPKLKINSNLILKKIIEFETNHSVKFLFCNDADTAKEVARSIFKRMVELYGEEINRT